MTDEPTTDRRIAPLLISALLPFLLAAPLAAAANPYDAGYESGQDLGELRGSYSYVRILEGSATLIQGDTGDRDQLQVNQPILVGDRLWVAPRGRVEVVLSDRNFLRIDAGSEVVFEALAGSPDRKDSQTVLRVPQGNVQLVIASDFLGEGLPRVDTPNATVYAYDVGTYRITADGDDWTEVVAREGSAEVVTPSGSLLLREDEEAIVEGTRRPVSRIRRAGRLDSLELWGSRLDREARYADVAYVDDSLRYEAATLDRYGSWVSIEGRYAWRPRVASDWRPYWNGRWSHSPLGYTWVSYEPWGWVPYHYGTWDYVPAYGWAWFPGSHFAPAWVYWYWTDAYVGWVPVGYYTRFYRSSFGLGIGFRFGHYGWVGGHWSHYRNWNFCDLRYFGHGHQHRHVHRGDRFSDHSGHAVPRRGILTTDTRAIPRDAVNHPDRVQGILAARTRAERNSLPDATPFVARKREIGDELRERVLIPRSTGDRVPDGAAGRKEAGRSVPILLADEVPGASVRGERKTPSAAGRDRVEASRRNDEIRSLRRGLPGARAPVSDRVPTTKPEAPDRSVSRERPADRIRSIERNVPDRVSRSGSEAGAEKEAGTRSWRDRAPVKPRVAPDRPSGRKPTSDRLRDRLDRTDVRRDAGSRTRTREPDRSPVPRRVIERVRDQRQRKRSLDRRPSKPPTSTRSRSSSPPPKSRGSSVSDRSSRRSSRSSVSPRSSSRRSSARSSSRSSSSRSSGKARSGSRGRSRSKGKPPQG